MTDYYELLYYYEQNPLTIHSENDIPTTEDIHTYIIELEARYHKLRDYYEITTFPILESFGCVLEMNEVFYYLDEIIKIHKIDFAKDSVPMMLGKIMYMLREPDYGGQFHLIDITDFDFHKYYIQDWFDVMELAKCQSFYDDFHVNLYEYFDSDNVITDKSKAEI